jgi:potassium voltage-gated channel Eag-related subfamily H protein 5
MDEEQLAFYPPETSTHKLDLALQAAVAANNHLQRAFLVERNSLSEQARHLAEEKRTITSEKNSLAEENRTTIAERRSLGEERLAITAERNSLAEEKRTIAAERNSLNQERCTLTAERDSVAEEKLRIAAERNSLAEEKRLIAANQNCLRDLDLERAVNSDLKTAIRQTVSTVLSHIDMMADRYCHGLALATAPFVPANAIGGYRIDSVIQTAMSFFEHFRERNFDPDFGIGPVRQACRSVKHWKDAWGTVMSGPGYAARFHDVYEALERIANLAGQQLPRPPERIGKEVNLAESGLESIPMVLDDFISRLPELVDLWCSIGCSARDE